MMHQRHKNGIRSIRAHYRYQHYNIIHVNIWKPTNKNRKRWRHFWHMTFYDLQTCSLRSKATAPYMRMDETQQNMNITYGWMQTNTDQRNDITLLGRRVKITWERMQSNLTHENKLLIKFLQTFRSTSSWSIKSSGMASCLSSSSFWPEIAQNKCQLTSCYWKPYNTNTG